MGYLVRGMYVIWGDENYINKMLDSGINTLLFSYQNHLGNDKNPYYQSATRTVELSWNITKPCVKLLNPHWFRSWDKVPDNSFAFMNKRGDILNSTPCIANKTYIQFYMNHLCETAQRAGMQGIIIDFEEYDKFVIGSGVIDIFTGKRPCYCDSCKSQGIAGDYSKQFKIFAKNSLEVLSSFDVTYGQMPYKKDLHSIFPSGKNWWYSEDSYGGIEPFEVWRDRMFNITNRAKYAAGIWAERFSAENLLEAILDAGSCPFVDGYWIFNAARFSKHSPLLVNMTKDEACQFIHSTLIDIEMKTFFDRLSEINKKIDKNRDSFWFKIMSALLPIR